MLEYYITISATLDALFRRGANAPLLPFSLKPVDRIRPVTDLLLLLKALYLPGYCLSGRLNYSITEGAGLLPFPAPSTLLCWLPGPGASHWLCPADGGTFMSLYYSGGLFRVHNVVPCSSGLCPEKLGLSNTLKQPDPLSFSKPPHRFRRLVTS